MKRLTIAWTFLRPFIYGFILALALLAVLFLKAHWKGFSKFLADPAFFDNIEVTRNFEVKK